MKYKDYEDFVEYLKTFDSDRSRVEAIEQYFLGNVDYNYDVLTMYQSMAKMSEESILKSIINGQNIHLVKDREDIFKRAGIEFGFSKEILREMKDKYYARYLVQKQEERKDGIYIDDTDEDILHSIIAGFNMDSERLRPVYRDGLIKKGVCRDYAIFMSKICADIGIKCSHVNGVSTIGHAWNILDIGGRERHYDLTYEIFVRDGYAGWDKRCKAGDWTDITFERMCEMQPTRKINMITPNNVME